MITSNRVFFFSYFRKKRKKHHGRSKVYPQMLKFFRKRDRESKLFLIFVQNGIIDWITLILFKNLLEGFFRVFINWKKFYIFYFFCMQWDKKLWKTLRPCVDTLLEELLSVHLLMLYFQSLRSIKQFSVLSCIQRRLYNLHAIRSFVTKVNNLHAIRQSDPLWLKWQ